MKRLMLASLFLSFSGVVVAQGGNTPSSPYAGQESRPIKSLSHEDIAEPRQGGGWGLAKVAELNGMPGPAHLLELKNEIPLSNDQVSAITAIFERMRADAIAEGERFIAREQALEEAFRSRTVTNQNLRAMLAGIEKSRSKLRHIHLATHLSTPALLTENQIARYKELRGYVSDPCADVPQGHDPVMWRRHNGCE